VTPTRTTDRWRGVVAVSLFAGAVGVFGKRPYVLLCAVIGVVYAVYPRVTPAPTVDLEIERAVSEPSPGHGDPAEVTVTVRNVGESTLPDLRIVDGVPPMLPVTGGSARHAAVLRPGASTTFSYEVTARHGTHRFEAATVIARDVSGMHEVETTVSTDTEIECHAAVPEVPLRSQTQHRTGRIVTDQGGSGIEFQQTREYRTGDPMNRVDWNRYARTGELTTVEFREERSASVLLCLDARAAAYRASGDDRAHAVSHAVAAAQEMLSALIETRDRVGVAAVGRELLWLAPGVGADHGNRARQLLATHPTLSMRPPDDADAAPGPRPVADGGESRLDEAAVPADDLDENASASLLRSQTTELRKRLDADTQVILLSPLPDDGIVEAALSLEAGGNPVTVVSPDVTTADTVGGRLARVERDNRVHSLHQSGVPVIDWDPNRPLGTVLLRAAERWSS
jgi:uncharacterized protein (DUF58 family)